MRRLRIVLLLGLVAALVVATVPALAQETATETAPTRKDRPHPAAWVDLTLDEHKAQVAERAASITERIEGATRLSDEEKSDRHAAIDELRDAVNAAESNAEVAGLVVSRTQLERQEARAQRRGEEPDYEQHLAGDIERAERRFERLSKVVGWADAAGEDVAAINGYLETVADLLDVATGSGTIVERHDAVHIALAWMTEAAAATDNL